MIYAIQILKMLNKNQRQLFVALFNDLEYEIEELGYRGVEQDLIADMMFNHFGIEFEVDSQLEMFTAYILKHQNNLDKSIKGIMMIGMKVA